MDVWFNGKLLSEKILVRSEFEIIQVPAGIFLPTIAIGACLGRAVGLLT